MGYKGNERAKKNKTGGASSPIPSFTYEDTPIKQFVDNFQDFLKDPAGFYEDSKDPMENAWNGEIEDETDYWFQQFLLSSPLASVFQGKWNKDALMHYMSTYGLTWQDLISRNVFGGQFGMNQRPAINFIGDMVKELYS